MIRGHGGGYMYDLRETVRENESVLLKNLPNQVRGAAPRSCDITKTLKYEIAEVY